MGIVEHARDIASGLADIRDRHHAEIAARFPNILRSNGGYGLDRLGPPGQAAEPIKIICGIVDDCVIAFSTKQLILSGSTIQRVKV